VFEGVEYFADVFRFFHAVFLVLGLLEFDVFLWVACFYEVFADAVTVVTLQHD